MELLLQYIISNIIDMVAVLLVTFMLQFHIGRADPQSDDAQEKSLSTVWNHDPGNCSWSSESAMLNSKKILQLSLSMEKSPSWQGNSYSVNQEITWIMWNSQVHYWTHKCPPFAPNPSQNNPVHTAPPTLFLEEPF